MVVRYTSLPDLIAAAIAGTVVSFPTDTLPALAVRPEQAAKLYRLKGRSETKPLILMAAQAEALWPYIAQNDPGFETWLALAQTHWPGALTLVLPASGQHPSSMTPADASTLGIRVPNCAIAREILAATGPLATTSANRSGEAALVTPAAIAQTFPTVAVLAPEARARELEHPCATQDPNQDRSQDLNPPQASTVVRWIHPAAAQTPTGSWEILRQGTVEIF